MCINQKQKRATITVTFSRNWWLLVCSGLNFMHRAGKILFLKAADYRCSLYSDLHSWAAFSVCVFWPWWSCRVTFQMSVRTRQLALCLTPDVSQCAEDPQRRFTEAGIPGGELSEVLCFVELKWKCFSLRWVLKPGTALSFSLTLICKF